MLTIIYKKYRIQRVQTDTSYEDYKFLKSQHRECVLFFRRFPQYFKLKKEGIIK